MPKIILLNLGTHPAFISNGNYLPALSLAKTGKIHIFRLMSYILSGQNLKSAQKKTSKPKQSVALHHKSMMVYGGWTLFGMDLVQRLAMDGAAVKFPYHSNLTLDVS